ncbi:AAA family ATPase [Alphaproteobacteria bacterium LSUCC0744]
MVSFAEMLKSYGVQNDAKSLFSEMLANAPSGSMDAPLDRDKALMSMKAGNEWHNNMVRLVASFVREGLSPEETIAKMNGVTLAGYTELQTIAEITKAYEGAKAKGFSKPKKPTTPDILTIKSSRDAQPLLQWLHQIPDTEPNFLVDRMIERGSLAMIFGQPASGKSFLAVDLAASIATGRAFQGLKTQKGDVVYIAGEGYRGLKRRFTAWATYHDVSPEEIRVMISRSAVDYSDEGAAKELEKELLEAKAEGLSPILFVIDTLARNHGGDENSNLEMGKFISVIDQFNVKFDCATLIVHHSGHGESQRARGASALRGALDSEFSCKKDRSTVVISCSKMKDAEAPENLAMSLKSVELGVAKDGKQISSAVLIRNDEAQIRSKITVSIANKLKTFQEAVRENGNVTKLGDVILEKSVSLEGWREIFYRRSPADTQEAKRKAFERARKDLVEKGFLEVIDDIYTLKIHDAGQTGHDPDS